MEYAAPIWNQHREKHVNVLEKIKKYATSSFAELRGMNYEERQRN